MAVQPGEEKVPWKPHSHLPVSEGPAGKQERDFGWTCSDRTRRNGYN